MRPQVSLTVGRPTELPGGTEIEVKIRDKKKQPIAANHPIYSNQILLDLVLTYSEAAGEPSAIDWTKLTIRAKIRMLKESNWTIFYDDDQELNFFTWMFLVLPSPPLLSMQHLLLIRRADGVISIMTKDRLDSESPTLQSLTSELAAALSGWTPVTGVKFTVEGSEVTITIQGSEGSLGTTL